MSEDIKIPGIGKPVSPKVLIIGLGVLIVMLVIFFLPKKKKDTEEEPEIEEPDTKATFEKAVPITDPLNGQKPQVLPPITPVTPPTVTPTTPPTITPVTPPTVTPPKTPVSPTRDFGKTRDDRIKILQAAFPDKAAYIKSMADNYPGLDVDINRRKLIKSK